MPRNQRRTAYDPTASYGINRGRWLNEPDPERDDTETEGLPLPAWADGYPVPHPGQETRR